MKKIAALIFAFLALSTGSAAAQVQQGYVVLDGNKHLQTMFSFMCESTWNCPGQVLIDYTGSEVGTSTNPLRTDPTGTTPQPVTQSGTWATSGLAANGAVPSGNPNWVAGWDGTYVRALLTDSSGRLVVNGNGTFTVVQPTGTNLHIVCDSGCSGGGGGGGSSQLDAAAFTAGTSPMTVVGGLYSASIPTLTNGQAGAAALTADRNLFVNLAKLAGVALGAPSNYGTAPGAVEAQGVNAYVTNAVTVAQATAASLNVTAVGTGTFAVQAAQSGSWSVTAVQPTGTNLHMVCDSGCSAAGAPTDEGPFTPGTTGQSPVGGFYQTTATSNPLTTGQMGAFQVTANRALFTNLRNSAGAEIGTSASPLEVGMNTTPSLANGSGVVPTQGGAVLSATNGGYQNILQSNAVLSATNGLYVNLLQGNAVVASGNPIFAQLTGGSATIGALTANQTINVAQVNGVTTLANAGAVGTGSQRVAVGQDATTIAGSAPGTAGSASANVISVQGIASMTPLLVNPGTAANFGVGTIAASVPGNAVYVGLNVAGNLRGQTGVSPTGSVYAAQNDITSLNGVALGSPSNYGTGPGAVAVLGVNAFVTNTVAITASALPLPSNAAQETGGNLATLAGAVSASVLQANLKQVNGITTLAGAGTVGTGAQRVAVGQDTTTIAGAAPGSAGVASANVITVQGIASMTPLQVAQATASSLNATVVGTGTFAVQAAQSGTWTVNPTTIATWGLATTAPGAAPTNMQLAGAQYNSSPIAPTNGQSAALQADSNGYLEVNIKAGAAAGGTSQTDAAAFTYGTTPYTPIGGVYNSSITNLSSGDAGAVALTAARSMHVLEDNSATILSTLGTINTNIQAPPALAYQATWGSACSYSSGDNQWCGDPKGAAWVDIGAINGAAFALGQAATTASLPVVLPNNPDIRPSSGSVTAQDTSSTSTTGQNGASIIIGAPTSGSAVVQSINGQSGTRVLITGTWTGTLQFEGSPDGGTTWTPIPARVVGSSYTQSAVTGNGQFFTDLAGLTTIRVRATAAWTGTAVAQFDFTAAPGATQVLNPIRIVDNATGAQAAIAPASTPPTTAQAAVVTTPSPDSPYHLLSAATANSTNVKSSAGVIHDITITQTTTTLGDFRLYDSATAPTCSSATGVIGNWAVQSNAVSPGMHLTFPNGKVFVNGISFCLTGAVADNDNTNFTTGVQVNMDYK